MSLPPRNSRKRDMLDLLQDALLVLASTPAMRIVMASSPWAKRGLSPDSFRREKNSLVFKAQNGTEFKVTVSMPRKGDSDER